MMKIKICCISSIEEAEVAIECGASAIGLVSRMPSGPGVISEELISEIIHTVNSRVETFLLTSETSAEKIIEQHSGCTTSTIQLVDHIDVGAHRMIKETLPEVDLVQVIHVTDRQSINEAITLSHEVDALLLDSGNQKSEIKELGGTGKTHNWEVSAEIVKSVNIPVWLAGGLNPANIARATSQVNPWGVDICSGVRTDGKLDCQKLEMFIRNLNSNPE